MISLINDQESRYNGVKRSLELIKDELVNGLRRAKRILIKPNWVSTHNIYSATHVDSVKAIIDFIYESTSPRKIIIGEGPTLGSFREALINYGYEELEKEYDVEFIDLNEDEYEVFKIYDENLERTVEVRVSKTALASDYRISVCRPKTHDTVIVTLTIKNMVMGSIQLPYKSRVHRGFKAINLSLALLAAKLMPSLAVIDGFEGMEGAGPVNGEPIKWGIYIAGTNALEVDALTTWLMGFNSRDVGYLHYLSERGFGRIEPENLNLIGSNPVEVRRRFKPHPTYNQQLGWK